MDDSAAIIAACLEPAISLPHYETDRAHRIRIPLLI